MEHQVEWESKLKPIQEKHKFEKRESDNEYKEYIKTMMPKRAKLINFALSQFKFKDYLEIGCAYNECFDNVEANHKVGVDPKSGGTLRMTSDDFFKVNLEKFDVIFIDGDHEHKQVLRDFKNALMFLRKGGIIFLHDLLPPSKHHAIYPLPDNELRPRCGTSWRVMFDILTLKREFFILKHETGIGVFRDQEPYIFGDGSSLPLSRTEEDSENIPFDKMLQIKNELPIIEGNQWMEMMTRDRIRQRLIERGMLDESYF